MLTKVDIEHAVEAGSQRNSAKDPTWTRRKSTVFNDRQLDCLGMLGELAVAKALGLEPDWTIHVTGDRGVDLVLRNGMKCAVKFNHRKDGYLMVERRANDVIETDRFGGNEKAKRLHDIDAVDLLVLSNGPCQPPEECTCKQRIEDASTYPVRLSGWVTKDAFLKKAYYANWGLGGRFYLPVMKLNSFHRLWQYMLPAGQNT
tara:strand:+ start:355 stop:960 length:606 start_codon:yes stop_codon:yes gene_type:complete